MNDETELSECVECGGVTEPQKMTIDEWWGEELFLFEKVPVRVCRDCGEVYIAADVAKRLETEMQTKSHCYRQVSVPVVAYEEMAA
ncbi:YgiT-type zinc finger protein [Candidatus Poribacteria bacterium]|nr:YgiT-type zinc finger protein [Candidatus Poribacteria bacterium]